VINLGPDCMNEGTVTHEILHALGFYHEQSRFERDTFVKINWENIKEDKKENFEKQKRDPILGAKFYDYHSIMHYSAKAFSKNGKKTIERKSNVLSVIHFISSSFLTDDIGTTERMTELDKGALNTLYNCPNFHEKYFYSEQEFEKWSKENN